VGEGEGDQEMKRNNKTIHESKQRGFTLLYFDKHERNKLVFRFQAEYDSYKTEKQRNSEGILRNVIIFKLKIID